MRVMADGMFTDGDRTRRKADMISAMEGMRRKGRCREWSVLTTENKTEEMKT